MRTQTPTPPFDVAGVEMARYGSPQHEMSATAVDSMYGPPQHETTVEDPEWLISIAARAFSLGTPTPAPISKLETESELKETEPEPTMIRL